MDGPLRIGATTLADRREVAYSPHETCLHRLSVNPFTLNSLQSILVMASRVQGDVEAANIIKKRLTLSGLTFDNVRQRDK